MPLPSPYSIRPIAPEDTMPACAVSPFHADSPNFREYLRVIAKHKWLVIGSALAALVLTTVVVLCETPTYTARATILIERQTPQVLDSRQAVDDEAGDGDPDDFYRTQYDILESRSLAVRVINTLQLANSVLSNSKHSLSTLRREDHPTSTDSSFHPAAANGDNASGTIPVSPNVVETYLDNLEVLPKPGTRLVTVAFTSPEPRLSAEIVNAHILAYIKRGTELRAQASESAEQFLKAKLADLKSNVEKAEAALNDYRRQRGIVAESPDDKAKIIMERLSELNKALTDVQAERIDSEAQVRLLAAHDYKSLPEVLNQPMVQTLSTELARVEGQYASVAAEYKADYPPLANLDAKRREIQARLDREIRHITQSIKLKQEAAITREDKLREEIEREKKNALALNGASLQDSILSRAVDTNRELYKHVLARINELAITAAISASNVSIVDYAQPPRRPSSPKVLFDLAASCLLGLFAGIATGFGVEHFDDTLKDPDQVLAAIGLPSLGFVPDFAELARTRDSRWSYLIARGSDRDHSGEAGAVPEIIDAVDSLSSASEAYRAVRLGILFSRSDEPPKAVLVTSASPGEGKTVTTINTAIAFAQMGQRVLVIDADLRRPRCHSTLGIRNALGLADILTGQADPQSAIQPTHFEGLFCLPAGSAVPNPAALLASKTMATFLDSVKSSYDSVLFDSAPILPVTDSLHLATLTDGVIVVVAPQTSKEEVKRACALLVQAHAQVFGVVLNRYPVEPRYYQRYYHYYRADQYSRRDNVLSKAAPEDREVRQ